MSDPLKHDRQELTFLISDLHLSSERPEATAAFKQFLRGRAQTCSSLYILGDLFEAWIGDDDPAPLAQQIISELRSFTDSGRSLYFLVGNRDFAIGRRFAGETGCKFLADHHVADLYGKKVLLEHGDTLCTEDIGYQRARRIIRNPLVLAFMKSLPLRVRQQIGIRGRQKSRAATSEKSAYIMDVNQQAVHSALVRYKTSTMIHGHTHRPDTHCFDLNGKPAQRIVLGAWYEKAWLVEASPAGIELKSFDFQADLSTYSTTCSTPPDLDLIQN
jgi:UDP-2,3-diacylglucosamine hydrolase